MRNKSGTMQGGYSMPGEVLNLSPPSPRLTQRMVASFSAASGNDEGQSLGNHLQTGTNSPGLSVQL
jgi:hypothetical protein